MKPSLSCKPNQRVERSGTPLFLVIFLFLGLLFVGPARQNRPSHSTTVAAKCAPSSSFRLLETGRGISRPGQIHRKAVTPPKWIGQDAVIFRNRRNPRPSKQPPDIPYTLDPIDLPSRFDNHDE